MKSLLITLVIITLGLGGCVFPPTPKPACNSIADTCDDPKEPLSQQN